jgi:hypothetical protein
MAVTTPKRTPSATTPRSYRAAVVHDFHSPLTVQEVSAPALEPGQIRVRVEASGLCHTDIHAAHGDWPVKPSPPFIRLSSPFGGDSSVRKRDLDAGAAEVDHRD